MCENSPRRLAWGSAGQLGFPGKSQIYAGFFGGLFFPDHLKNSRYIQEAKIFLKNNNKMFWGDIFSSDKPGCTPLVWTTAPNNFSKFFKKLFSTVQSCCLCRKAQC